MALRTRKPCLMSWRTYDRARALAYDAERAAPDEDVSALRELVVRYFADMPCDWVVDIGAGTGLWSDRLARWVSAPVIAVEPSSAMLKVLTNKRLADVVAIRGRGEALPLGHNVCGAAWLSTVVHHFDDLGAAVAEAARVLAPGGRAYVRSSFPDQQSGDVYPAQFFPTARNVAAGFPTLAEVTAAFGSAGLELRHRHTPREVVSPTRQDFLGRVVARADSLLREVSDDEFASGLRRIRQWVKAAPHDPVLFHPDLLVFG